VGIRQDEAVARRRSFPCPSTASSRGSAFLINSHPVPFIFSQSIACINSCVNQSNSARFTASYCESRPSERLRASSPNSRQGIPCKKPILHLSRSLVMGSLKAPSTPGPGHSRSKVMRSIMAPAACRSRQCPISTAPVPACFAGVEGDPVVTIVDIK
jgi:hypothetical protein